MSEKKIFIFIVCAILVVFMIVSSRGLKVKSVVDGETVELNNGALVRLLGITPTAESKEQLKKFVGEKVEVIPDASQPFKVTSMENGTRYPAYLLLKKGGNINSKLLLEGVCCLNEAPPLRDSLDNFRLLALKHKREDLPEPERKVIDYEEDSIVLPPYKKQERKESAWWGDGNQNLAMLEEACDYNLPYTKTFANKLAAKAPGPYNIDQVCEIFDYCYNNWSYVNDPKDKEYLASASESIEASLTGDCDDFSILIASCVLAIGGEACINTGSNASTGGHAFTEVNISQWNQAEVLSHIKKHFPAYNISSLATRRDGNKVWLNLDWQAAHPGGKYYDCSLARDSYPYINGQWTWVKLR